MKVYIDSFSSTDLKGKSLTYENIKRQVLAAGRFSCFEASETAKHGKIFTALCRDPELEILKDDHGFSYPWTGVRLKSNG
jgi:hypothetical protein